MLNRFACLFAVVFGVAHTTVVSLSHIGSGDPPDYVTDPNDGFIYQKSGYEESPLALSVGQDWLEHIMKMVQGGGGGGMMLDMYGSHGKILMYRF